MARKNPTSADKGTTDIIQACLTGDHQAWVVFISNYRLLIQKAINHTLLRYGADPARDGEDVLQEVFMRLFRGERRLLATFDQTRSTITTWLAIVARSTTLDYLRTLESARHISVDEVELATEDPDQREQVLSLPRGVLSPRQRAVVSLLFERDQTVAEAAESLDVHPQTIRSLRHNAFARLRRFYKDTARHTTPRYSPVGGPTL